MKAACAHLRKSGRKDNRLPLLDVDREIARDPEVLRLRNTTLHILDILDVPVPIGGVHPLRLARQLHVERRITFIQATGHPVLDWLASTVELVVGDTKGIALAERQERTELKRSRRVRLNQRVTYKQPVLFGNEYLLLC